MSPSDHPLVSKLIGCHNFLKGRTFHFHAPIATLFCLFFSRFVSPKSKFAHKSIHFFVSILFLISGRPEFSHVSGQPMIQEVWGKQGQLKRLLIVAQGSYKAFIRKTTPKVANQSCARMQNGLCVKSEKCSTLNPFFKISF